MSSEDQRLSADRLRAANAGDEEALMGCFLPADDEEPPTPAELAQLAEVALLRRRHRPVQLLVSSLANSDEAVELYLPVVERMAARGEAAALYVMGWCHVLGAAGFSEDEQEGFRWLQRASDQDYAQAHVNLAQRLLASEEGGAEATAEGARLLERAVAQGNVHAKFLLGYLWFTGYDGVVRAIAGYRLVEEAANAGFERAQKQHLAWQDDPEALVTLGLAMVDAEGATAEAIERGVDLVGTAAAMDSDRAQDALAQLLLKGTASAHLRQVASLIASARARVQAGATDGNPTAQALLGFILLDGHGGSASPASAEPWLTRAAAQGNPYALEALDELTRLLATPAALPERLKIYVRTGTVADQPADGFEPRVLPIHNEYRGPDACYIAVYGRKPEGAAYGLDGEIWVHGLIRLNGHYKGRIAQPAGYEGQDISAEEVFKALARHAFPHAGHDVWVGGDTGGFGTLFQAQAG